MKKKQEKKLHSKKLCNGKEPKNVSFDMNKKTFGEKLKFGKRQLTNFYSILPFF